MGGIAPSYLQSGDTVALVAPARAVSREEMEPFKKWVAKQGWHLLEGKHVYGRHHQFSGTDAERASDVTDMLLNTDVKAIFCGRGGYGSMRLSNLIPANAWQFSNIKWMVGFSDITTLHLQAASAGWQSIHGPMAVHFHATHTHTDANSAELLKALTGLKMETSAVGLQILNSKPFSAEIVGGNLSLIYAALGTPEQPNTNGKVLFIEDLDEYLYHIDRMIVSLKNAGLFENLAALVIGGMTDMKDNAIPFGMDVKEIIDYHCQEYQFPIVYNFPAGHTQKNVCIKLGADITFDGNNFFQN